MHTFALAWLLLLQIVVGGPPLQPDGNSPRPGEPFPKAGSAWILGLVRTSAGAPVDHATVDIRFLEPSDLGSSDMEPRRMFTRKNGTFTDRVFGEGYFEVCVSSQGARQCRKVEVQKGKDSNADFTF